MDPRTNYKGNPNLKPAAIEHAYTEDEVKEFIRCQKNPAYFIETMSISSVLMRG